MSKEQNAQRTKIVQSRALAEIDSQIIQWKIALEEYNQLSTRVESLPNKLTHDIMVPFGNLAFMPGQVIHSNEFMMHLGDSWFANMSAAQVLGVVGRRKNVINENIKDLETTRKNLLEKSQFVDSEMLQKDILDIKEEVPSEYQPPQNRKRKSKVKPDTPKVIPPNSLSDKEKLMHANLMQRLNELELEEECDAETDSTSTDSDDNAETTNNTFNFQSCDTNIKKNSIPQEKNLLKPLTIKFKHSNSNVTASSSCLTPGNVDKLILKPKAATPREQTDKLNNINPVFVAKEAEHDQFSNFKNMGISENVVEGLSKSDNLLQNAQKRPLSKFKAAKQKRQGKE